MLFINELLTVVIPCKNEGDGIQSVLKLLRNQNQSIKVIVADSSDTDVIYPKYVKVVKGGLPAVARNNGAKLVETPYVLFLDADIYLKDENLLQKCLVEMVKCDYDLMTCRYKSLEGRYDWVYRVFDIIQWVSSKTKPFAVGGFMLFKTEVFNKIGGFNEEDKIAEDYHLSSKIKPSKFKIQNNYVYTPSRRFDKKGVGYMIKLAIRCWWNRNNDNFFKKDYNYWK